MTIRTIINIVLTDLQDTIKTLQMTIRTIISIVLTDPQDTIKTLRTTIRTIINIVLTDPQDTIKTLLWGCIFIKWNSPFWILFEELLFVILKVLLINKPSQPGCTQNTMSQALHSSPQRTAYCVHNVLAHSLSQAPPSFWAGPGHEAMHINICIILCMHDIMHMSPQKMTLSPTENQSGTKVI